MDPQRRFRVRRSTVAGAAQRVLRSVRTASPLVVGAAVWGCAGVGESPRDAYALPAPEDRAPQHTPPGALPIAATDIDPDANLASAGHVARHALDHGRLGLFPAHRFALTTGRCVDCALPDAALWWFRDELIAIPKEALAPPVEVARASAEAPRAAPGTVSDAEPDMVNALGAEPPGIVWLGAPQRISGATLSAGRAELRVGDDTIAIELTPPMPANVAYADAATAGYFSGRPLTLRGALERRAGADVFVARTIWPEDERLDLRALSPAPLHPNERLGTLVEAQTHERYRLLHTRSDPAGWAGRAVIALVLSGAQGDDDGAHAGHLAVATGVLGERGEWDEWLVTNFYPLVEGNAKGIIPSVLPMDNYLYELNSGQQYYRPSYMLVAVLEQPRAAVAVQHALQDTLRDLHCGAIEFDRTRRNSTAMTIDPLREIGWRVPGIGPTSRLLGLAAAPIAGLVTLSPRTARGVYAALAAERTRLLPRVAFEVMGHDLLQLAALPPNERAELTPFERLLGEDIEALLFVRLPQVPSSRRFGTYPAPSLWAFGAALMSDPAGFEAAPKTEDRVFPETLRGTCGSG